MNNHLCSDELWLTEAPELLGDASVSQTIIDESKTMFEIMRKENAYAAHNYHPLPVVLDKGRGIYVWDTEGRVYMDFVAGVSAVNQGHAHPRILSAFIEQASRLHLTSRGVYNSRFGPFAERVTAVFGYDTILPMNTGAEGVETAIKIARKWAYEKKKIPVGEARILSCRGNYHGRTIGTIAMSIDPLSRDGFGPFPEGLSCSLNYNSVEDLENALEADGSKIAAFIVEPIQGEGGVVVPNDGYLTKCYELCKKHNVLFIADEIQTGMARTGRLLCIDHENLKADMVILSKSLSGGVYPVSAVLASNEVMSVICPGEHGSTFGGNPLACAAVLAAIDVTLDENLAENANVLGQIFREGVLSIGSPLVQEVRGKGLLNAVVINESKFDNTTWDICLLLRKHGIIAKNTKGNVLRFAPPLCIKESEILRAIDIIRTVLTEVTSVSKDEIPYAGL
ncbi:ornithine aminotransferase [Physocladia obscura]|uniref:Ornithine aminotransferase n=1 Tax=Physocladia obscura TaxID=109957 RepID=A0AAD5SY60_9FUNG|nr:ornithine aminotransferase [Physocladia obscura]